MKDKKFFIVSMIINFLVTIVFLYGWQRLELFFYGEIQPRVVDNILGPIFLVSLYLNVDVLIYKIMFPNTIKIHQPDTKMCIFVKILFELIILSVIFFGWQLLELLFYGEVQPRIVDSIIGLIGVCSLSINKDMLINMKFNTIERKKINEE